MGRHAFVDRRPSRRIACAAARDLGILTRGRSGETLEPAAPTLPKAPSSPDNRRRLFRRGWSPPVGKTSRGVREHAGMEALYAGGTEDGVGGGDRRGNSATPPAPDPCRLVVTATPPSGLARSELDGPHELGRARSEAVCRSPGEGCRRCEDLHRARRPANWSSATILTSWRARGALERVVTVEPSRAATRAVNVTRGAAGPTGRVGGRDRSGDATGW